MDKVRCLLIQSGLPNTLWAEATCTVAYLINRSPSTAIEKKTPMEMWSGHPSDYRMLRIFSCVAYSHVKQGKLEPRAVKCILLGYPEGMKGYRLYRLDGKSPKIVTSRNVVFNESVMYKDTLKDSGADQTNQEDGDDEDVGDQETDQTPDLIDYQLTRDREPRTRMKPLRFQNRSNMAAYAFAAAEEGDTHEPLTYQEAVACEYSSKWKVAMEEEMDSLRKNKTWELVYPSAGQKLVSSKWLFKIKEGIEGVQNPRYKARLVAGGFTQRACIDYNEVFSPVVRHTSTRVILALTACKDYKLEQLDVKTAFLHGNLKEVIYIRQPPGYEQDDMLIACKSKAEIGSTKSLLKKEFDMKELREAKKILGMEIVRDRSRKILPPAGQKLFRHTSIRVILSLTACKDYELEQLDVKMKSNCFSQECGLEVGSIRHIQGIGYGVLEFLGVGTTLDIFQNIHILYLQYSVLISSGYGVLSFIPLLSLAKYMALTEAVKEAIWLRGLLEELGVKLNTVAVNCDNHGAIHLSRNHVFHERTKHINVHYHFFREVLESKTVNVLKVMLRMP
ncbi:retrotransposon protein, putative, ty1-copia subclass [Tanacetum coccineum]